MSGRGPISKARKVTDEVYDANRRVLWGYCYRMTGDAADVEGIVQEAFVWAPAMPWRDTSDPWRPWHATGADQVAVFELGKRIARPTLTILERRTGKKFQLEK